jgi:DNA ligase-1
VNRFARLLDALIFSPSRNTKLRLLKDYFTTTPDPARGYALAALTDGLEFRYVKPGLIRELVAGRVDPVLFELSYDFVGDLAETASLIWPAPAVLPNNQSAPAVAEVVETLQSASRGAAANLLAGWFDRLDATGRWALIKLVSGALRVGVSARLAKLALADFGNIDVAAIDEVWHGLTPPYAALFAWLEQCGPRPVVDESVNFRPMMLATPLEETELAGLDPSDFRAEWKWDGIRVQIIAKPGIRRLYSRTGDDIAAAFPDIVDALAFDAVLDGELLVRRADGEIGTFNDLQQRLNRKAVTAALSTDYPAFVRLYDILFHGRDDLRGLPFIARRRRLEAWHGNVGAPVATRFDLSPLIHFASWDNLQKQRAESMPRSAEGLMLKRADSPYVAGRPKGPWFKWKREARTVDTVLMYAQRGHGKRSSFYSDFTFGCWRAGADGEAPRLVPVGKAYFGFTDEELAKLDRWVRSHTVNSFGPVREVEPHLVVELAFDSVHRSTRHKSGLALRFPRVHRIRWDKPAAEADTLDALTRHIE